MQSDRYTTRGVAESLVYPSVQIFLKFLTLQEIYILKDFLDTFLIGDRNTSSF